VDKERTPGHPLIHGFNEFGRDSDGPELLRHYLTLKALNNSSEEPLLDGTFPRHMRR
jgi:hypothetical protein